jgi:hypothetical protein
MAPEADHSADARLAYDHVVKELTAHGAQASSMFGMPCLKLSKKAFAGYYQGDMVFKLRGAEHARALSLPGAHLFDPSSMGRPMKEWVQVPGDSAAQWPGLAHAALHTVA